MARNARTAAAWSSVAPARVCSSSSFCSACSSVEEAAYAIDSEMHAYAAVGPAASRVASSRAIGSTCSVATAALSSPISRACSAVNGSASSSSAVARPAPTSRGSVQESPESAASPMPAKAVV